ncbi:MAG: phosphate/phosphite/phosphonate ABC transporter substrate-binding protein [Thiohalomonadales bacterium]
MKNIALILILMISITGCELEFGKTSISKSPAQTAPEIDTSKTVYFGVQAPRGEANAISRWSEFGRYLQTKIGKSVSIVPLKPNKTVSKMQSGEIDFMLSNPTLAAVMVKKGESLPIATMNRKSGHQLAGVIISKKGSGITKAKDLIGKRVMGFKFRKSAAAYIFQVKHLMDQGIDPHKDFKEFVQASKQDRIIDAVKDGSIDAGFIKSGLLEAVAAEGKISLDDFIIVDQKHDDFPLLHTTELYPSWTVTAGKHVDVSMVKEIKSALLDVHFNKMVTKASKIMGFIEPENMDSLLATLEQLGLMK